MRFLHKASLPNVGRGVTFNSLFVRFGVRDAIRIARLANTTFNSLFVRFFEEVKRRLVKEVPFNSLFVRFT